MQEFTQWFACSPNDNLSVTFNPGCMKFGNERRQNMTCAKIKIVFWPIEIARYDRYITASVLLAVRFKLYSHDFCNRIPFICGSKRPLKQRLFLDRLRSGFG